MYKMNVAMKKRELGRPRMGGSEEDKETHTGTGDLPARSPLVLFGCDGFSWGTQDVVPSTDAGLVTGETLWACNHLGKPEPVLPTDVAVEKTEVQPGNSSSEKVKIS